MQGWPAQGCCCWVDDPSWCDAPSYLWVTLKILIAVFEAVQPLQHIQEVHAQAQADIAAKITPSMSLVYAQ